MRFQNMPIMGMAPGGNEPARGPSYTQPPPNTNYSQPPMHSQGNNNYTQPPAGPPTNGTQPPGVYSGATIPIQRDDGEDSPKGKRKDDTMRSGKNPFKGLFKSGKKKDSYVPTVGSPFNVQHNIHVDFNSVTGFEGLPQEWEVLLKTSGITKDQVLDKPEAVLDVLSFHDQYTKQQQQKVAKPAVQTRKAPTPQTQPPQQPRQQNRPPPPPVVSHAPPPPPPVRDEPEYYNDAESGALPEEKQVNLQDLLNKEDPNTIYRDSKKVGEGAAGEVFLATDSRTGLQVAIKKMPLNSQNMKLLVTEIGIMKSSQHPNIVQYVDSFLVVETIWVVMEFMDAGCLTEVLEQFENGLEMTEGQIAAVCADTLAGLEYIHMLHRIHRDIKSDNILMGSNGAVKLGNIPLNRVSHPQPTLDTQRN